MFFWSLKILKISFNNKKHNNFDKILFLYFELLIIVIIWNLAVFWCYVAMKLCYVAMKVYYVAMKLCYVAKYNYAM